MKLLMDIFSEVELGQNYISLPSEKGSTLNGKNALFRVIGIFLVHISQDLHCYISLVINYFKLVV